MNSNTTTPNGTFLVQERGFFWWADQPVPESHFAPETAVAGELRITLEGRVTLDLYSLLSDQSNPLAAFARPDDPSFSKRRIQGILIDSNRRILLLDLSRRAQRHSFYGVSTEGFWASYCLIGDQRFLRPTKTLLFSHLEIDFKGFEEWLSVGSIQITRRRNSLIAKYKRPEQVKYALDDGNLTILHDLLGSHDVGRNAAINMTESTHFRYTPNRKIIIDQVVEWHGVLQDFVIVMTDSDYCFDWPIVLLDKIRYTLYFEKLTPNATPPLRHQCATNFPRIKEKFGALFSTWRTKREKFGSAFYLYLGTRRGMQLYPETRFAMLIWGIEAFHRNKYGDSGRSGRTAARIQNIISQLPAKKDRKWLASQLRHANEPNLEQRIFETLNGLPIGLDPKRLRKFASECARKRHEISHFGGQRQRAGVYSDFVLALYKLSDALSSLYHALLISAFAASAAVKFATRVA